MNLPQIDSGNLNGRHSPPSKPAIVALCIASLFAAGAIGWIANSLWTSGRDSEERQPNKTQVAQTPAENNSSETSTPPTSAEPRLETQNSNNDKSNRLSSSSPVKRNLLAEMDKPLSTADPKLRGTVEKADAMPRFSELPSFRDQPTERFKLPKDLPNDVEARNLKRNDQKSASPPINSGVQNDQAQNEKPNRYSLPQQESNLIFFQELIVDRQPTFRLMGLGEFKQAFQYRVVSKLEVGPADSRGFRKVAQQVVRAELIKADERSKESLAKAIKKLPGKTFQYVLDRKQKIVTFKGKKEEVTRLDLKGLDLAKGLTWEGMLISSTMDLDGWQEMARLSFLLPDDDKSSWKDQMSHHWDGLGQWVGETEFEKRGTTNGLLRIDYAHWMQFSVGKEDVAKLPLTLESVEFESTEAGGRVRFDVKKQRLHSLVERFRVRGDLQFSLLGTSSKMEMSEVQSFHLRLYDQDPQ